MLVFACEFTMIHLLSKMPKRRRQMFLLLSVMVVVTLLVIGVSGAMRSDIEGLYLLKESGGRGVELATALYLGEEGRLINGFDLPGNDPLGDNIVLGKKRLDLVWHAGVGHGYLSNHLGDGTVLVTNFSRYRDSEGLETHGLFIGGASPGALRADSPDHLNSSGMTWFDGKRWNHIWCNTNEGIGSTVSLKGFAPSAWTYLGSRIEMEDEQRVVVSSSHEVRIDNVPLQIARTIEARAGEPYLRLQVKITNVGSASSHYFYYYGDEPWVGDFGSSRGDVGWTQDRLVEYETLVDPKSQTFAGMVDHGSDAIGEGHSYRHVANFIDWRGPDRPDIVFFANHSDGFSRNPRLRVPLQGDSRSIGMYWGPRMLAPGQSQLFTLTVGMAELNPTTGMPRLPATVSFLPEVSSAGSLSRK